MWRFSLRTYIRLYVRPSPPLGHPARPEAQLARPQAQPARPQAQTTSQARWLVWEASKRNCTTTSGAGWLAGSEDWLASIRPSWLTLRPGWLALRPDWLALRPNFEKGFNFRRLPRQYLNQISTNFFKNSSLFVLWIVILLLSSGRVLIVGAKKWCYFSLKDDSKTKAKTAHFSSNLLLGLLGQLFSENKNYLFLSTFC